MSLIIWEQPKVHLLAQTAVCLGSSPWGSNDDGFNSSCDTIAEIAGRVCYDSFGNGRKKNVDYLANILKQQHESVLEHATVTFGLEGISRSLSHELVRHRHLSFSQRSQRYCKAIEFVLPMHTNIKDFQPYCEKVRKDYEAELAFRPDNKVGRQEARFLLPNCVETKMVVTGNLRAWRHFVKVRGAEGADAEIRRLACAILYRLQWAAPHCVQDLGVVDGFVREVGANGTIPIIGDNA